MGPVLLVIHIAGAVLLVGPAAVAASLFPRYVPVDAAARGRDTERSGDVAAVLQRICRLYGALALIVPVAGLVLGLLWGKLDQAWLVVAMIATAAAGVLYALRIVPAQAKALAARPSPRAARALAGAVGAFDILWLVVLILMVLQPGGTRS